MSSLRIRLFAEIYFSLSLSFSLHSILDLPSIFANSDARLIPYTPFWFLWCVQKTSFLEFVQTFLMLMKRTSHRLYAVFCTFGWCIIGFPFECARCVLSFLVSFELFWWAVFSIEHIFLQWMFPACRLAWKETLFWYYTNYRSWKTFVLRRLCCYCCCCSATPTNFWYFQLVVAFNESPLLLRNNWNLTNVCVGTL